MEVMLNTCKITDTQSFSSIPQKCQNALELSKTLSFVLSIPPKKSFSVTAETSIHKTSGEVCKFNANYSQQLQLNQSFVQRHNLHSFVYSITILP